MKTSLFLINDDVCATTRPGWYKVNDCPFCQRGKVERIGTLHVDLTCKDRGVIQTLFSQVLVDPRISEEMQDNGYDEALFIPVITSIGEKIVQKGESAPEFVELSSEHFIVASDYSVEFEDCMCGAVEQIHSNPLFVKNDESITARSVRKLVENPNILILGEETANYLKSFEPGLILDRVYYEDEYEEFQERTRSTMWEGLLDDV